MGIGLIPPKLLSLEFGQERDGGLDSILNNIEQTFCGDPLYKTAEEKAAHLLYFVIMEGHTAGLLQISSDNSILSCLKVTGIIMGIGMSGEVEEKVKALASKYNIKSMLASVDPKGYAVKISDECDNSHAQEIHAEKDITV